MHPRVHPLAAEHQALDRAARDHKRQAQRHRDAAQRCRARQAEVAARCRQLGIDVIEIPREGRSGTARKAPGR